MISEGELYFLYWQEARTEKNSLVADVFHVGQRDAP